MSATSDSAVVTKAQKQYDDAVRAERLARIAAGDSIRAQARRRAAGWRLLLIAGLLVAVVFACLGIWALVAGSSAQGEVDERAAARDAAAAGITTMLTADPARAGEYVDGVRAVSTGKQRERIDKAGAQLQDAVAGLGGPTTGRVISAGAQGDSGDGMDVLVVAQASAPELVGGAPGTDRVAVKVHLVQSGDRWLIADTEQVS